jgi:hypothetical protein
MKTHTNSHKSFQQFHHIVLSVATVKKQKELLTSPLIL